MFMGWYSKIEKFFLEKYDDYPIEIQKKMKNLFVIDISGLIFWSTIVILRWALSLPFSLFIFLGDVTGLCLIPFSLYMILTKKPVHAGNATIALSTIVFTHFILADLFGNTPIYIGRVYETIVVLNIIFLFIGLFAIKRIQFSIYTVVALSMTLLHYFIILFKWYDGIMSGRLLIGVFVECIIFIGLASIVSKLMLSLTVRARTKTGYKFEEQ